MDNDDKQDSDLTSDDVPLASKSDDKPFSKEWLNEGDKHEEGHNIQYEDETEPEGSMPERVVEDVTEEAEEVGIHAQENENSSPRPLQSADDLNYNARYGDMPNNGSEEDENDI